MTTNTERTATRAKWGPTGVRAKRPGGAVSDVRFGFSKELSLYYPFSVPQGLGRKRCRMLRRLALKRASARDDVTAPRLYEDAARASVSETLNQSP